MIKNTGTKPTFGQNIISLTTALMLIISLAACGGGGGGGGGGAGTGGTSVVPVTLTVSPATASVITGMSIPLTANVAGVTWSVNGIAGGNATVGTINASGIFTAPAVKPTPAIVTVTATTAGATQSASAQITIINLALTGTAGGYAGVFNATGNLITARSNHSATLLASGDVLVAGGIGAAGAPISAAEVFKSAAGNFAAASPMGLTRAYHTATLLQNGKVLITGGFDNNNNVLAQSEIYDPATGTFAATGSMAAPRAYHSATLLLNGLVLIAGGSATADLTTGTPLASVELYDPVSGTFTSPASTALTDSRYYHTATLLNNGKVLLTGGISVAGSKLPTAELYDPNSVAANKISTTTGPLATGRWLHTATLMVDGRVLIAGGSSGTIAGGLPSSIYLTATEIYDPVTGTFGSAPSQLIDSRGFFTTTLLADQTLLSAGGFGLLSGGMIGTSLATAELFDATGAGAVYTGSMPLERANYTSTMLPSSGKVLIIGGGGYSSGSFAVLNSAILYQ